MRIPCIAILLASGICAADPIVIAHRGASGYLPEHTLEAYSFAYALGADYIEPDLVLTKDDEFICLHDIHLESTTNVEELFPDRKRADNQWYAADFTLDEIKQLSAHERLGNRFPVNSSDFRVPTFREMIELIQGLNKTSGRNVGIYPEMKAPAFHEKEGLPMEQKLIDILNEYGYQGPDARIYVQCFEVAPLKKLRELGAQFHTVMLVDGGRAARELLSQEGLKGLSEFTNGIGPSKTLIEKNPAIVDWAHERGLVVHPYTMRADDFPQDKYKTFEDELRMFYFTYKVDGVFTDFADRVVHVVAEGR